MSGLSWRLAALLLLWGAAGVLSAWRGAASAWLLFYGIGALLGMIALQAAALRSVQVEREADCYSAPAGVGVRISVRLKLSGLLPALWIAVEEPWRRCGTPFGAHRRLLFVGFRTSIRYGYRLAAFERGAYEAEEIVVYAGDLFGFYTKRLVARAPLRFLVRPRAAAVAYVSSQPEQAAGSGIRGVRDYAAGDPLNRIHWRLSAAHDRLKTKLPEADPERELLIALDGGHPDQVHLEKAVEAAAGYALAALAHRCEVGLDCVGTAIRLAPERAHTAAMLLDLLAPYSPPAAHDAARWLSSLGRKARGRMRLCLVTSRLDRERIDVLERLVRSGVLLTVLWVYADASADSPSRKRLTLLAERGCRIEAMPIQAAEYAETREGGGGVGA